MATTAVLALPVGVQPTEQGINGHFDNLVTQARSGYLQLTNKSLATKHIIAAGIGAVGILTLGAVAIIVLKTVVELAVLMTAASAFGIGGLVAWKKLPRFLRNIDLREIERIQQLENEHLERLQQERNRHLAALKAEARENPVEQLQNYLQQKAQQLKSYQGFVAQIGGQVKSAIDMLDERKKQRPDRDYSKKDAAVREMQKAYQYHLNKAEEGKIALENLKEAVEDAKFDWKFGQVGQAAMQNMQALSGQDLLNEMLASESFDSVRENFNQVFSEIEVQIGSINTAKQLDFGEGITLDVSAIHIPTQEEFQHVKH